MSRSASLFSLLGIKGKASVTAFADRAQIKEERLRSLDQEHSLPVGGEMERICRAAGMSRPELMLRMGVVDRQLLAQMGDKATELAALIEEPSQSAFSREQLEPVFKTENGQLYKGDCLDLLRQTDDGSIDLVFADPPFNLDKEYPSGMNDNLKQSEYLDWCESWLEECVRVLKPGGSLFVWNLPKWCVYISEYLSKRLVFRHWVAVDIKYRLPIAGRLYPSHYSLLYYTKGRKPDVFSPDRLPAPTCRHCFQEQRDYGGYKHKMNPKGVSLTDVWYDIPPVRHAKYKNRSGSNELSLRLMDRIIEMASRKGDVVFDPFGGAGTTYAVAEMKGRRWVGIELGPVDGIIDRLSDLGQEREYLADIRGDLNHLFPPAVMAEREKRGHWTPDSVRKRKSRVKARVKNQKANGQLELTDQK